MSRPGSRISVRQFAIIHRMRIDGVKADQVVGRAEHYEDTNIVGLGKLVGCPFEEIIDLIHAAGKSRSIMLFRIERLYGIGDFGLRRHLEMTVLA